MASLVDGLEQTQGKSGVLSELFDGLPDGEQLAGGVESVAVQRQSGRAQDRGRLQAGHPQSAPERWREASLIHSSPQP